MSLIKKIAARILVSTGNTKIRGGILSGRLLPHSIASTNLAMVLGRYETDIQQLLASQAEGCKVAYDVGSHVGFFTLLLADAMGQDGTVVAFEPSEGEASRVEELIDCNNLTSRVSVERMAIYDEVAELTFFTGHESFTGILDKVSKANNRENQTSDGTRSDARRIRLRTQQPRARPDED